MEGWPGVSKILVSQMSSLFSTNLLQWLFQRQTKAQASQLTDVILITFLYLGIPIGRLGISLVGGEISGLKSFKLSTKHQLILNHFVPAAVYSHGNFLKNGVWKYEGSYEE